MTQENVKKHELPSPVVLCVKDMDISKKPYIAIPCRYRAVILTDQTAGDTALK
ncbi:MAG: hypothetical protein P8X79_02130 [Reinekea sp.]